MFYIVLSNKNLLKVLISTHTNTTYAKRLVHLSIMGLIGKKIKILWNYCKSKILGKILSIDKGNFIYFTIFLTIFFFCAVYRLFFNLLKFKKCFQKFYGLDQYDRKSNKYKTHFNFTFR